MSSHVSTLTMATIFFIVLWHRSFGQMGKTSKSEAGKSERIKVVFSSPSCSGRIWSSSSLSCWMRERWKWKYFHHNHQFLLHSPSNSVEFLLIHSSRIVESWNCRHLGKNMRNRHSPTQTDISKNQFMIFYFLSPWQIWNGDDVRDDLRWPLRAAVDCDDDMEESRKWKTAHMSLVAEKLLTIR